MFAVFWGKQNISGCGIRIRRVLEYGRIHPAVPFRAQAQRAVPIFYGLLLQHAQQLVAAGFIIAASAQFLQGHASFRMAEILSAVSSLRLW